MDLLDKFEGDLAASVLSGLSREIDLYLSAHRTDISNKLLTDIERGDFRAAALTSVRPEMFSTSESYFLAAQLQALFRKNPDLPGYDRPSLEREARERYNRDEALCRETNEFFTDLACGNLCLVPQLTRDLSRARDKIARILGNPPSFQDIALRFGPGASTETSSRRACVSEKLTARPACSPASVQYLPAILESLPHYTAQFLHSGDEDVGLVDVVCRPARLEFVEKDAFKLRSIAIEPPLTGLVQLGIGEVMEVLLKRHGIDLTDQNRHGELARIGSLTGGLATLDLSSASDTVATALVRYLLPPDWFSLLAAFRSPCVVYGDDVTVLEKFSSMGNGYTFPLESLIFYALTWAVSPGLCSTYGDDIICDSTRAHGVIQLLRQCGFILNEAKSFVTGEFRESCGEDYFSGYLVRPWFLKDQLSPYRLISAFNFFMRRYGPSNITAYLERLIPPPLRIYGPDGYGDGHLLSDRGLTPHNRERQWAGYTFETYSLQGRTSVHVHKGDHIALLYFTYTGESSECSRDSPVTRKGRLIKTYKRPRGDRSYHKVRVYTLSQK